MTDKTLFSLKTLEQQQAEISRVLNANNGNQELAEAFNSASAIFLMPGFTEEPLRS